MCVHLVYVCLSVCQLCRARRYDLVLFPDQRHGPRSIEGLVYMEDRILDFFSKHLRLGLVPSAGMEEAY